MKLNVEISNLNIQINFRNSKGEVKHFYVSWICKKYVELMKRGRYKVALIIHLKYSFG